MAFRRLVRGQVAWDRLEGLARELAVRYELSVAHVEFLDAENWLSTPLIVNDRLFLKVISERNTLAHAVMTTTRNLGIFSTGTEGFFERFESPIEMAEHEFSATERIRELGVNAPEPIETFEYDGLGVVVFEYLPAFDTLDELPRAETSARAPELFAALSVLHENGLAHGDLHAENVVCYRNELYFIDATRVRPDAIADARSYDLACALAVLEPLVGARRAVEAARTHYGVDALLAAREFVDYVSMRPDHDFDAALIKGELEKAAT